MDTDLNALSLPSLSLMPGQVPSKNPAKLAEAATQFEALMITQMMKSARESSGDGWLSDGDETGEDTATGMAEEQFAQALAQSGGLGLAKMVIKTMSDQAGATTSPTALGALPLTQR
jgi:Rod binding domain-containing protein